MSVKAMNWAFGIKLDPTKKIILLALADEANSEGKECFPGYTKLAEKSCVCTKTIKRNINKLVDMGLISKTNRRSGKQFTSNYYELHLDVTEPVEKDQAEAKPESENKEATGDNLSLPTHSETRDTMSTPSDNKSLPEKNLPEDKMSIGGDSRCPQVGTPGVPIPVTTRDYPTDSDTDDAHEPPDCELGIFGSHLVTGCHPYLYWFLRTMEQKEQKKPGSCTTFGERLGQFGLSGGYCQTAINNFLKTHKGAVDSHLLKDPDAGDYQLLEQLVDNWQMQAEEFIREADDCLDSFRETLLARWAA